MKLTEPCLVLLANLTCHIPDLSKESSYAIHDMKNNVAVFLSVILHQKALSLISGFFKALEWNYLLNKVYLQNSNQHF